MRDALALDDGRDDPPDVSATGFDRLGARDFQRLAEFIQGYSGIKMPPNKVTMVEGRLRRRVRALGLANLQEYCRHLFDRDGLDEEAIHLIDAVTTDKTEFIRCIGKRGADFIVVLDIERVFSSGDGAPALAAVPAAPESGAALPA